MEEFIQILEPLDISCLTLNFIYTFQTVISINTLHIRFRDNLIDSFQKIKKKKPLKAVIIW